MYISISNWTEETRGTFLKSTGNISVPQNHFKLICIKKTPETSQCTVEPPVSDHPKCQVEVVAYESLDHNGS